MKSNESYVSELKAGNQIYFSRPGDRALFLEWLDLEHPFLITRSFNDPEGFGVGLIGALRTNQCLYGLTDGEVLMGVIVSDELAIAIHNEELLEKHRGGLFWAKLTDLEIDKALENKELI